MTTKTYKDNQDFFDNSTTNEKLRIIGNNIEEWQIIPTRRGQFIASHTDNGFEDKGAGYIFRAKVEDNKGKIKRYMICSSVNIDELVKVAYYKLKAYINNNIFLLPTSPEGQQNNS